jgi:hypothetical protein
LLISLFFFLFPQIGGAKNSPAKVFAVEVDADGAIIVDTARVGSSGASL